jgi:uncharacterized membrane protein
MKTENVVLMRMARESLKGKWGLAIGGYLIFLLISSVLGFIPVIGSIGGLIIAGPLMLGLAIFSLSISRNQEAKVTQIFEGFNQFERSLVAYLLMMLFTFLWSLLFIIPGIIAGISYSMIFFIIAEDSSISARDALKKSKKMMYGYKWKYFRLQLRFLGLGILCIFTLGIGFLWLVPYMQISMAKFYDDVKVIQEIPVVEVATPSVA